MMATVSMSHRPTSFLASKCRDLQEKPLLQSSMTPQKSMQIRACSRQHIVIVLTLQH